MTTTTTTPSPTTTVDDEYPTADTDVELNEVANYRKYNMC